MTTALIIIAILFVAASPLVWVLPSAADKRRSALRQAAARQGLTVQLRRLRDATPAASDTVDAGGRVLDQTRELPAYSMRGDRLAPLPDLLPPRWRLLPRRESAPGRLLERDPATGAPAPEGLAFDADFRLQWPAAADYADAVGAAIATLPPVVAVEAADGVVTAFWEERGDAEAVGRIAAGLSQLLAAEAQRHARCAQRLSDPSPAD